jgi:hypothetical protein
MLTGEIRGQIDQIWNAFWSGGIANPLEVIEQITYLLFLRRLDDLQTLEELKSEHTKKPIERRIFPLGKDAKKFPFEQLRWSRFKNLEPRQMYEVVSEHVFPFLRTLGGDESTYTHHMKDARFTIPTPALLAKVVDLLDQVPMEDRDTKGDLYEYMLGKIATAGQNGQFRTPRHIIRLMVEMAAPAPRDIVCDPACGTCGFLVAVGEYLRERHITSHSFLGPQHLRNIVRIITETGLRIYKELTPMRKDQVDLHNAVVWIPDSKTPNGIAEVPLTSLAIDAFKSQMAISGEGPFLFPSNRNPSGHQTALKTVWQKTLRRAKVPYFRIYDLRSTYATRLSAGGVADEWVTQMLRQSDAQVFKKYSQMKLQMKREALEKINRRANEMARVAADILMAAPMCTVTVQ